MTLLEQIKDAVANGRLRYVENLIEQALQAEIPPVDILNLAMLPGMRIAGEQYRNSEGDIPRILSSARSMRKGLEILEPYLESPAAQSMGKVILGTVEGDLHDVGKNLVAIMFRCAGFEVIDLGVDVSERQFLRAIRENPDVEIVCISSLLTTTNDEMRRVVRMLRGTKNLPQFRIMVGGGSVTQAFADEIGADAYTETAVDAAERAKCMVRDGRRNP